MVVKMAMVFMDELSRFAALASLAESLAIWWLTLAISRLVLLSL